MNFWGEKITNDAVDHWDNILSEVGPGFGNNFINGLGNEGSFIGSWSCKLLRVGDSTVHSSIKILSTLGALWVIWITEHVPESINGVTVGKADLVGSVNKVLWAEVSKGRSVFTVLTIPVAISLEPNGAVVVATAIEAVLFPTDFVLSIFALSVLTFFFTGKLDSTVTAVVVFPLGVPGLENVLLTGGSVGANVSALGDPALNTESTIRLEAFILTVSLNEGTEPISIVEIKGIVPSLIPSLVPVRLVVGVVAPHIIGVVLVHVPVHGVILTEHVS